jgi:hypothetical protein
MDGTGEPRYKDRMKRSSSALMLLICSSLVFAACKKSEDAAPVPIPTGAASPTPVANDPPPAAVTQAPAAGGAPTAVTPPVAVAPTVNAQPIDGCCSALAAVSKSGRGADAKSKAALASKICSGIAPLVKAGKTTRTSALTTIRAQMAGVDMPSECH